MTILFVRVTATLAYSGRLFLTMLFLYVMFLFFMLLLFMSVRVFLVFFTRTLASHALFFFFGRIAVRRICSAMSTRHII